MQTRLLGTQGLQVSKIGLGCMGMSVGYGAADEQESIATIHRAMELGVTLFNTADAYGAGDNEQLLGGRSPYSTSVDGSIGELAIVCPVRA